MKTLEKKVYITFVFILLSIISSCSKDSVKALKSNKETKDIDNIINNLNISGYEKNNKVFNFNAKKAYIEKDNKVKAKDTNLTLLKNNKVIAEIKSKNSIYNRELKVIDSNNNNIKIEKDIVIKSPSLSYKENENKLYMKDSSFIYGKNNIRAKETTFNKDKKITMKKVSATLSF